MTEQLTEGSMGGQWEMNFINRDKAALGRIKVQAARPLLKKKMFYSYYMIKKYNCITKKKICERIFTT